MCQYSSPFASRSSQASRAVSTRDSFQSAPQVRAKFHGEVGVVTGDLAAHFARTEVREERGVRRIVVCGAGHPEVNDVIPTTLRAEQMERRPGAGVVTSPEAITWRGCHQIFRGAHPIRSSLSRSW